MSSVTNAVARQQEQPAGNIVIEENRLMFAEVLPSHIKPETWVRVAQGALRRDDKLAAAAAGSPASLVAALLDAARRGLEPGTEQYYLVPFKGQVQGIVGYQGEIELMYRAGAISAVVLDVIREKDTFQFRRGHDERPHHDVDWFADDRGALKGVYAYAVMKDGATSHVVVMNRAEVMEHKAMAQGTERPDSPWRKWEKSMWLKTAVHELTKFVPTSAEYLRDMARAQGEMMRHASRPTSAPPAMGAGPSAPSGHQQSEPIRAQVIQGDVVASDDRPSTPDQRKQMFALWNELGFSGDENRENRLQITAKILGMRDVPESSNDLTFGEMDKLIGELLRKRDAKRAG